ncbi:erythromycin esterase family protein [Streptomyces sp. NBC_00838]|uniref:erythromycin esterase family protein n=1 Tax=Streptomyces sp. NBC_00838 TaxID=2903680 RepID=UPI00386FABB4|nr:erythromycin esterase family protein [Streptomyces sp. NBC_00838]
MPDQHPPARPPADWIRAHSTELTGLGVEAPLDDLEPLREIIGDSRVVGLGENAHFVEEFSRARQRVLRFLAERCGFTVLAFEFGFSEGFALDRWVSGGAGDEKANEDDGGLLAARKAAAEWGFADFMAWLRRYNRAGGHRLRLAGLDVPAAGGALRPALDPVTGYLREVGPDALPLLERVLEISDRFLEGEGTSSGAAAAPAWGRLEPAEQNELTATLARLLLRLRAVEPLYVERGGQRAFDIARRRVEAACHTDYMFQAMNALLSGRGSGADLAVREIYLAESVRWHLDRSAPGTRIVLAAHNNHIQKTTVDFGGPFTSLTMGGHLHHALGGEYRAIALTHTADHVPEMYPDPASAVGFTLADARLEAPVPGSVEAALVDAGLGGRITLTGLGRSPRDAAGAPLLNRIRSQSATVSAPLPLAFDAVLSVPTVTRVASVPF